MRILLCEDDPAQLRLLERLVADMGHSYATAATGREAWKRYLRGAFDLVLADWRMPGLSGTELLRRIRALGRPTHIVLMSARSDTEHVCNALHWGADDFVRKPYVWAEFQARIAAAERVIQRHKELLMAKNALVAVSQRLRDLARRDALTDLANRGQLDEDLALATVSGEQPLCLAICDVDRFKEFNDHYGHLEGDRALRAVAGALRSLTDGATVPYRFGGEEFVIMFRDQDLTCASECVARLHRAIRQRAIQHRSAPGGFLTLSVGLAQRRGGEHPLETIRRADGALYLAKENGRARTEFALLEPRLVAGANGA